MGGRSKRYVVRPEGVASVLAWVEVDLDVISANVRRLKAYVTPGVKVMAVVKSDAYGYGMIPVAKAALSGGADWLAVASVDEGITLRNAGINAPALVLGSTPPDGAGELVRFDLTQALSGVAMVAALRREMDRQGKKAAVHLEVDTGMGHTGVLPCDVVSVCRSVLSSGVELGGVFTHFSSASAGDGARNREQFAVFTEVLDRLKAEGIEPGLRHSCNSTAIATFPRGHLDMVRSGCAVLGFQPTPVDTGVVEAVSIKSRVEWVKRLSAGSPVGYGCTHTCGCDSTIACVSLGYSQGLPRALAGKASVLIKGQPAPIVGKVSMNRFAADVTGIDGVEQGDEVVIVGRQGQARIALSDSARSAGIGVGEFLVPFLVPRVYLGGAAG